MNNQPTYVIVGASLAGATAAKALRDHGFSGRIVLVGDETELPYERPLLSKGYLMGTDERAKIYVHQESWYAEHAVELLLGRRVTLLDRVAHQVELDTGERITYSKLLLATGASPRRLRLPGGELEGVHYLRRVLDADLLRETLREGRRIVVVGAGWIGLETAAAGREAGCDVTVIDPQPAPLLAALGSEMGAFFAGLHRRHGVDLRLSHTVTALKGSGKVASVRTDDGGEFAADAVIVGIGALPNVDLAEQAGLSCDNGIVVDEMLCTQDPYIYAVGDVANSYRPFYGKHLRTEHWANALYGAPVAAQAMLGQQVAYDKLPYFFTDQFDVGMEFSGWIGRDGYDRLVTRGDVDGQAFHAFWLSDDRVVAGMHVNRWDDGIAPVEDLIRSRRRVDPDRLADVSVPLTAHVLV
ncbi:3-phenylpropionate/trans-cinnamate dioxygenase ferredoxin reductase subunit [Kribbella voronezhensis]|uniref:3-phenylpropionate/trans-cinnamate dioxygenase ferredoxin reductase subunit n=1 Tax=Kribbella voronezhensis TaxID=2512212 RepID=A0A4R7T9K4_9ACTN|nr:FAD-dependent oxidoreductase [Kribbella voronezhensis]TDU87877.1 3-phenylpropionate/trans-cinnamate dioxygenase ferredoxin reductase subunit [Kribbella voronezhensis]